MSIKVESGIPLPKKYAYSELCNTIQTMSVGDSFLVTTESDFSVLAARSAFTRHGMKCAVRRLPDGSIRVWRKA